MRGARRADPRWSSASSASVAPDAIGDESLTAAQKFQPRLGLDLEGGTSIILTPRQADGSGSVPRTRWTRRSSIIRNRVDSFGVAESEVTTAGDNIVISIPGKQDKKILATVQQTAELRFRPVLAAAAGGPIPQTPTSSPSRRRRLRYGDATESPSRHRVARRRPTSTNNGIVPRALRKADASTDPAPTAERHARRPTEPSRRRRRRRRRDLGQTCRQQFAELDCSDPEKVRQTLRTPAPTTPRSRWSPASRTAARSTSSARPRCSARTSSPPPPGWRPTARASRPAAGRSTWTSPARARRSSATPPRRLSALQPTRRTSSPSCWTAWSSPRPAQQRPDPRRQAQITGNFTQRGDRPGQRAEVRRAAADLRRRRGRRRSPRPWAATSSRPA